MNVEEFLKIVDKEIEYGPGHAIISENISGWIIAINKIMEELAENETGLMLEFDDGDVLNVAKLLMAMMLNLGIKRRVFAKGEGIATTTAMINELGAIIAKYTKSPTDS